MRIGFLGTGIMGSAMARNILEKGYDLTVYNRTPEKTKPLEDAGASVASSPLELVKQSDVILCMVTDPEAVNHLLRGNEGAAKGLDETKIFINMSTVPPDFSLDLDKRITVLGADFLDAPVSGSQQPAQEGSLVILASGPEDVVQKLEPVFMAMGKKVVYCGEAGKGSMMKMSVNLLLGVMLQGLTEAVNFGQKGGLSADLIVDTILAGPLGCGLYEMKADMLKDDTFQTQFPLKHMFKDLRFVLRTARETGAATLSAHAAIQSYNLAYHKGLGDEDFAAVKKAVEQMSS